MDSLALHGNVPYQFLKAAPTFMRSHLGLAICVAALGGGVLPWAAWGAEGPIPIYRWVIGEEVVHRVNPGDTLWVLARRLGLSLPVAAEMNALPDPSRLRIGQALRLSNRHIVPATFTEGIVINIPELALYWLRGGRVEARFPVAVGRAAWWTPPGRYAIVGRRRDPTWYVPPSIQREMQRHGEPVRKVVPPGPQNPLGNYWLQLSLPGYGIHGTNAPESVGRFATHGCMRLRPEDIERLFREVPDGTPVHIVEEPAKVAQLPDGRVFLEVHRGLGAREPDWPEHLLRRLEAAGLGASVDSRAVLEAARAAWGVAVDVTSRAIPSAAPAATRSGDPVAASGR